MRRLVGFSLLAVIVAAGCSSSKPPPFASPTTEAPSNGKPTGSFTKIAEQTNDGLHWRLSQAPGANGTTCWKIETGPAVDLVDSALSCSPPPTASADPSFNAEFPFATGATTGHDIVVGLVHKPITDAQFQFIDPATKNLTTAKPVWIDKQNGNFVWAGKSKPLAGSVQVTLADNSKLDCGPGDIQSAGQLGDKTAQQIVKKRQLDWTCTFDVP
jgi:hypothetical protein